MMINPRGEAALTGVQIKFDTYRIHHVLSLFRAQTQSLMSCTDGNLNLEDKQKSREAVMDVEM